MGAFDSEQALLRRLLAEAGRMAMAAFRGPLQVEQKADGQGPVSEADRAIDHFLSTELRRAFPADALLTEESADDGAWHTAQRVWMIDPIDGTQEFITGVPEFAVMVGLCRDGVPRLGGVLLPPAGRLMIGVEGEGALLIDDQGERPLRLDATAPPARWRVAVSRSHPSARVDRLCAALGDVEQLPMGSVGLKIAAVAKGDAHLYVAATRKVKLWDTCGPEAILTAAGGIMCDVGGAALDYRTTITHGRGLLACGAARLRYILPVTQPLAHEFYGTLTHSAGSLGKGA